jgi:hypothetical protein
VNPSEVQTAQPTGLLCSQATIPRSSKAPSRRFSRCPRFASPAPAVVGDGRDKLAFTIAFREISSELRSIVVGIGIGRVLRHEIDGIRGRPEYCVARSQTVISLPPRDGILTLGRSCASVVSSVTYPVSTAFAKERSRKGLRHRANFINRVAAGCLTVIELAEGHNLSLVAVRNAECERQTFRRHNWR